MSQIWGFHFKSLDSIFFPKIFIIFFDDLVDHFIELITLRFKLSVNIELRLYIRLKIMMMEVLFYLLLVLSNFLDLNLIKDLFQIDHLSPCVLYLLLTVYLCFLYLLLLSFLYLFADF